MNENKPDSWYLRAQFDNQGLIDALKHEDVDIRRRAVAALRALNAQDAVPALQQALDDEADRGVRDIISSALGLLSGDEEQAPVLADNLADTQARVSHLIEMLDSSDTGQIIDAAQQLGEIGEQIAVEPLVIVFNSVRTSIQVKLAVAEALLKLDGAPVEVALLAALRHTDWHIRRNGAAILGQLKAEWAVDPLSQALRDSHSTVRRTARAALQRIGTPQAMDALHRRPSQTSTLHQPKPQPKPKPKLSHQETIPSAPRDGLLNRLRARQQAYEQSESASDDDTLTKHQQQTKRLDPSVIEDYLHNTQDSTSNDDDDDKQP